MLGRVFEQLFIRVWSVVKLTLYFWLMSLAGLFVLGFGSAIKSITELYMDKGWNYKEISVKNAFAIWKRDFKRANGLFWMFAAIGGVLTYNLYLSLQIRGLLFLITDFILIFLLTYVLTTYEYAVILDSQFEIGFGNLLKISLISNFQSFFTYGKLLLGIIAIVVLTWRYKALILFGMAGIIQVYAVFVTKNWRAQLDEQLGED